MSVERNTIVSNNSNSIYVTEFSGGVKRGRCIQLTQMIDSVNSYQFVQLDREQAVAFVNELSKWIKQK